jgi:hypothetical protein
MIFLGTQLFLLVHSPSWVLIVLLSGLNLGCLLTEIVTVVSNHICLSIGDGFIFCWFFIRQNKEWEKLELSKRWTKVSHGAMK